MASEKELIEQKAEAEKNLNEARRKGQADVVAALERELKLLEEKLDLQAKIIASYEKQKISLENDLQTLKEIEKTDLNKIERAKIKKEIAEKEYELSKKNLQLEISRGEGDQKKIDDLRKIYEEKKKEYDKTVEIEKIEQKRKITVGDILKTVTVIGGEYANNIVQQFTLNGMMTNFGTMVTEVLKTKQDIAKTTGNINQFTKEMYINMGEFGVGAKEAGVAFSALYTEMASFSNLNKNTQVDLVKNAAAMANLGVEANTIAQTFNTLNKSLKFGAEEVGSVTDKVAKAALGAGIAPAKAFKDLNQFLPQLAVYGKKSVDVFIDLQKQSKALGLEMSTLVGLVGETFDTFEGSAKAAGSLNAILGGDYLNSVQMLNATESERVELLKKAFDATGKDFDSLDKFEQKAIATSLGIKDMNEAKKLFAHLSTEDRVAMEKEAASQKELQEAQKASADAMRQMQLAMNQLYVAAEPLAKVLKVVMEFFAEHPVIMEFIFALTGLFFIVSKISAGVAAVRIALLSFGVSAASAGEGVASGGALMAEGIGAVGGAATATAPGLLALGAAIMLIGVGIGAAAYGVAQLVISFSKLSGEQALAAVVTVYGLAGGITALGFSLLLLAGKAAAGSLLAAAGAKGFLILGAAIMLIGGGIYLAATGMAKLVDSISSLNENVLNTSGLSVYKDLIVEIIDIIKSMPDTVEFTAKINNIKSIGETLTVAATAGSSAAIEPATRFVVAAKDYHVAQRESKTSDNDALIAALKAVMPTGNTVAEGGGLKQGTPVIIQLDGTNNFTGTVLGVNSNKLR